MANTSENAGSWGRIQQGVKDAEKLMGQRQYNMSMIKSRQTLEYMVKCLSEKANLLDGDLIDNIDELYEGKWISKTTCEHYHKIRMIGNKAVHDNDNSAYNANQAYHLLSQEVYTFANDYSSKKSHPVKVSRTESSTTRRKKSQPAFYPHDLLKILLPILLIIILIAIIKSCSSGKAEKNEPTTAAVVETNYVETTPAPIETTVEESPTQPVVYKTTTSLRVRSNPSTTDGKVLTVLAAGTQVDYVGEYDDKWSIIMYNGTQAYVSVEYLKAE